MSLTKKHFEQIGKLLAYRKAEAVNDMEITQQDSLSLLDSVFDGLIKDFIEYFEEENPRFDRYRFIEFVLQEFESWLCNT